MQYHFVITIQYQKNNIRASQSGSVDVPPSYSREYVFNDLVSMIDDQAGQSGGCVLFFSLEPNEL